MSLVRIADVFTVISNAALWIPFVRAMLWKRVGRAFVYFWMPIASALYHLCDSFSLCLFSFQMHHYLDFFFAELLIVLAALYIVHFSVEYEWLEWIIFGLGALAIVILQYTLPGDLLVQAGIVGISVVGIFIYWIVYARTVGKGHLPPYDWVMFTTGIALTGGSVALFSLQNTWPHAYWAIHGLWHISAALGQDYILRIKPPALWFQNAASKIAP